MTVRLLAFVLEEVLDIAIDCEMHSDWIQVCSSWPEQWPEGGLKYTDIRRSIETLPFKPTEEFFVGSKSAWLPWSAFDEDTYHKQVMAQKRFRWLYFLPRVLLLIPALAMLILVVAACLLLMIINCIFRCTCTDTERSNLWKEIRHTF